MNEKEAKVAQTKYVEAKLAGKNGEEAKIIAGYSAGTIPANIERIGGPVHSLLVKALNEKGIDESFLSDEYVKGISSATKAGAKDKDLNAHAQYLKQLGFLLGYGKTGPSIAVQVNTGAGSGDDPLPTRELIEQVSDLVEVLKETVGRDRSSGVHAGDPGDADPDAHPGVDRPVAEEIPEAPGSRGSP